MEPPIYSAVCKLAIAGEKVGFTVEYMIRLLNSGVSVEALVYMIEERLSPEGSPSAMSSARWIV